MTQPKLKIVGLSGSMNEQSTTLSALNVALDGAHTAGAEVEALDVRTLNLPMYAPGQEPTLEVLEFADKLYRADGLVWATPLYHGTISGAFKNAIDWLQILSSRKPAYLTDKPVGLIATAGGLHGSQAISTMEMSVRALRGIAVTLAVAIPQTWRLFDNSGKLSDEQTTRQLRRVGEEVVRLAARFGVQREEVRTA